MENRDLLDSAFVKFSIIMFLAVFIVMVMEKGKKKQDKNCTLVRAYIPIKGKWLEKEVCLEGEK